jgi:hypothetical protein
MLGMHFDYSCVPTTGTWGGIVVAWCTDTWATSHVLHSQYSLTLKLTSVNSVDAWWLTTIYGPQTDHVKLSFLHEIRGIRAGHLGPWLLCGDLNIIYKSTNKNNSRIERPLMVSFLRVLDGLELFELHLQGRLYNWSNEQVHPTMLRIDRAFACLQWLDLFPSHHSHDMLRSLTAAPPLQYRLVAYAVLQI